MNFVKMHGLGNDFVVIEDFEDYITEYSLLASNVCRRRWSVGADGLVLIQNSSRADVRMRMFNPDGSEAEMCGNALRCVAEYMHTRKGEKHVTVETGAGIQKAEIISDGWVCVDMGPPKWDGQEIPVKTENQQALHEVVEIEGNKLKFTAVSMGNPHCVIFVDDMEQIPWEYWGSLLEWHPKFPQGVNVEFVQITNPHEVEVKVWERGAGATLACGSGACAVASAGIYTERLISPVEVRLPGGSLRIRWAPGENVHMEGPAEEVFKGTFLQEQE